MQKIWRDKLTNKLMINRHSRYNTIIEKVYVYEVDGTTYDITNEFYDIQKDIRLSVFLLHFPRFNEGKNFVVQNKRQKSKERPNCNLYISKGERMKICA